MMRILKLCSLLAMIALFVMIACGSDVVDPGEEPLSNRVYLPTDITVTGGQKFTVPVFFENDMPLLMLSIPLVYSGDHVRCDSFSFVGSRTDTDLFRVGTVDSVLQTIKIGVVDVTFSNPIDTGRGLLGMLHFWAFGNAPDFVMTIDTTRINSDPIGYADTISATLDFIPDFAAGRVQIKAQQ